MKIQVVITIVFFLVFTNIQVYGQEIDELKAEIDSIEQVILDSTTRIDTKAEAYLALVTLYQYSNFDTILPLCEMALELVDKGLKEEGSHEVIKNLEIVEAAAYNNMGVIFDELGKTDKALELYKLGLALDIKHKNVEGAVSTLSNIGYIYENHGEIERAIRLYKKLLRIDSLMDNTEGMAMTLNNMGTAYDSHGKIPQAIYCYDRSLKLMKQIGDKNGIARGYNNMANIFHTQEEYDRALVYYKKALELYQEIENYSGVLLCHNNIGNVYSHQMKDDVAMNHFLLGLEAEKLTTDKWGRALILNNLGELYVRKGKGDSALTIYMESLALCTSGNDLEGIANNYIRIAKIYFNKGEHDLALRYANLGMDYAKQNGFPILINTAANMLSFIHEKKGNYSKALEYYQLEINMSDSLNNKKNQRAAIKQQAKYEYEKQKAIDDAQHEKQLAIEQEAKEKQQILTYSTAGGLGLVGIFLIFVFNRLKVTRKQKGIIELAHTELEEKNQEITDSIQYAKRIQSAILPSDKVVKEYFQQSFIYYLPKDIVAGDFYWLETVGDKVLFAAADCTGHGVPGAMVSVVCNNGLNRSVREHGLTAPGKILDQTRNIVVKEFEKSEEEVKDGMDIALCSLQGNVLEYAGAHNPLWIIRKDTQKIEEIKADKQPIGQTYNPMPYTTHIFELSEGDTIYIFSDGYADQFGGEKGKKMKTTNFKKLLLSIQKEDMQKQRELINAAFDEWKGDLEQLDDVCVIGIRV